MKKEYLLIFLFAGLCAACSGKEPSEEASESQNLFDYQVPHVVNTFDNNQDLYKVNQLTNITDSHWTGYSAIGDLSVVDDEITKGNSALRINYVSSNFSQGGFTNLISRFDRYFSEDVDMSKLGGISVRVYNNSDVEKSVDLELLLGENKILKFENSTVILNPKSWTECSLSIDKTIMEKLSNNIYGISLDFSMKENSVYYVDDLTFSFVQTESEESKQYKNKVDEIESRISAVANNMDISLETEVNNILKEYGELPIEYKGCVLNYSDLSNAITKLNNLLVEANIKEGKNVTLLPFDNYMGLSFIKEFQGGTFSYTSEEKAPGQAGSLKIDFDGTQDWISMLVSPNIASYDEIHFWIKSTSKVEGRVFNPNWIPLENVDGYATNENGERLQSTEFDCKNDILFLKDQWVEVVMHTDVALESLNVVSYIKDQGICKSEGTLYIGKVEASSPASRLIGFIDSLNEGDDFTDEQLIDISNNYKYSLSLANDIKILIGNDRLEKLEGIYNSNKVKTLQSFINIIPEKEEYTANEIRNMISIKEAYNELDNNQKKEIDSAKLQVILDNVRIIEEYANTNFDITRYGANDSENLKYVFTDTINGKKLSLLVDHNFTVGDYYTITLPYTITDGYELTMYVKVLSNDDLAVWPLISSIWGISTSHPSPIMKNSEGWLVLKYDIKDQIVDGIVFTNGPWSTGNARFLIGDIQYTTTEEEGNEGKSLQELIDSIEEKNEYTADEVNTIKLIKETYNSFDEAQKQEFTSAKLQSLLEKAAIIEEYINTNLDITAYGNIDITKLKYVFNDTTNGQKLAVLVENNFTVGDSYTITLPYTIEDGYELTMYVKNLSEKNIAFFPVISTEWGVPTNHPYMLETSEGWIELKYSVSSKVVDSLVFTIGPWDTGNARFLIGNISVSTIESYSDEVLTKLNTLASIDKDNLTYNDLYEIRETIIWYDGLSQEEMDLFNDEVKTKMITLKELAGNNYLLSNLEGDLADGFTSHAADWYAEGAKMPNNQEATIIFEATNITEIDGCLYIALFGKEGENFEKACLFQLNKSTATNGLVFKDGKSITANTSYIFKVTYKVADDKSSVEINVYIESKDEVIMDSTITLIEFNVKGEGTKTVKEWLSANESTLFHISCGQSDKVVISSPSEN